MSAADRNLGGRPGLIRHSARLPRGGGLRLPPHCTPHPVIGHPTLDSQSTSPLPRRSPGTNGGRQDIPRHGGPLVVTPCGRKCPEGPAPLASIPCTSTSPQSILQLPREAGRKSPWMADFCVPMSQHGGEAGKALAEGGGRLQGPTPRWGCCLRKNKTHPVGLSFKIQFT